MFHYILQVVAFQLLFLIIYDVLLRKETFFNLNRTYLLGTGLLSVVIPFIKIEQIKTVVSKDFVIHLPEVIIGKTAEQISTIHPQIAMQAGIQLEPEPISLWIIILISGVCITTLILLFKISKLLWLASKHPKRWNGKLLIVSLINSTRAFSFFHYVFLGEQLNSKERKSILQHEMVHVNQKHTLDLLFFEVLRIVFWFNPLVYMYQNRIATLHEFIADSKAIKQNNSSDYYNNLLAQVFETQQFSFVNPFFKQSLIKKRILMLSKSKSKRIHIVKYALLIPLVFTMLIYTSSYAQENVVDTTSETLNHDAQELTDQELYDKYYDAYVSTDKSVNEIMDFMKTALSEDSKYIKTREDFIKTKVFKSLVADGYMDPDKTNRTKTAFENTPYPRTYEDYLAYKKTDKAKLDWENEAQDGELRLVIDGGGSMTDEEDKKFKNKLDLLEQNDAYKTLLVVSSDGRTKMLIEDPKNIKSNAVEMTETVEIIDIEDDIEVPFAIIDEAPTFTFCDELTTEKERKQCMSDNVAKHVNKNFNTDLATKLGLVGRQRINVIFKIDKEGNVTGVRARAPHPKLEEEAIRVINTLPQFIPGKQKGIPVIVPYSLPILFQVHNATSPKVNDSTQVHHKKTLKDALDKSVSKQTQLNEVPFSVVDQTPLYDTCAGLSSEKDKKACVSTEVSKYVNRNFNIDLASKLGLIGRQRIVVVFTIDESGKITNIKARAAHPELEKEAVRVIESLPEFSSPGRHDGKVVSVPYSLPILFQVVGNSPKNKKN